MATGSWTRHRGWGVALVVIAGLAVILVAASFFAEEPLRRYAEQQANTQLPEYRTTIGALRLHPLTLAADLEEVVVRQQAHPEPPLAVLPRARAGLRLLPLLTGTVAADVHVEGPVLSATRRQIDAALKPDEAVKEQAAAWQDTVRDLMPVRVGLSMTGGEVTYEGDPAVQPVHIQRLDLTIRNVTNRPDHDEAYPAELHVGVTLLDRAQLIIDGRADPLVKPYPAVDADVRLRDLDIRPVLKIIGQSGMPLKEGMVEVIGHVEYGPSKQAVTIDEVAVKQPKIDYVNEAKDDDAPLPEWQDTVMGLFPITVHRVSVEDGEVIYRQTVKADPVRIRDLHVTASGIRNQASGPGEYPSEWHVSAQLPQQAQVKLDGRADFFAKPLPAVAAGVTVQGLRLKSLLPVAEPFHVRVRQGALDLAGRVEYSDIKTVIAIDRLTLDGADIDYVHVAESEQPQQKAKKGRQKASEARQDPPVTLKVKHGQILRSEIGVVNQAASPAYRVYMGDMNMEMDNVSNRASEGTGAVKVTGKFMGSGPTVIKGIFRPEQPTPDFDLDVRIIKTDLTALNNVFRAHGNFDTHEGVFAFFSEIKVRDGKVDGYVRPFLKDVEMYDPAKDRDKSRLNRAYKAVLGGVLNMLKNQPRDEVATHTDVSGAVKDPQASTWQIVRHLFQNAFVEAMVPEMKG